MKTTIIKAIGLVVAVLFIAGGLAFITNTGPFNDSTDLTETVQTNEGTTPEEMCQEVTRRQEAAREGYRQAVEDANLARDQAITDVEDPADLADVTEQAEQARQETIDAAAAERDSTLEALEAQADWCAGQTFNSDGIVDEGSAPADDPTGDQSPVHYYADDTPGVEFGPGAPEDDVNNAVRELYYRLEPTTPGRDGGDPALAVSTAIGLDLWQDMSPAERLERTKFLASNPEAWALVRTGIHMYIDQELATGNVSFGTYSGPYLTMDMMDGPDGTPIIEDTTVSATFKYLNIGGHWFKLNCGYQPVTPIQSPSSPSSRPSPETPTTPVSYSPPSDTPETPETPLEPKDPTQDVLVNPYVPDQVQGPGTTPVGEDPGPVTEEPAPEDDANDDNIPDDEQTPEPEEPSDDVNDDVVTGPTTGGEQVGDDSASQVETATG